MLRNVFFLILTTTSAINLLGQHCDEAYSAANYSVAHTNNAFESNNIKHVQEWTEKAMETLSEVEEITGECGCAIVSDLAYEAFEACDKSQIEDTYESARFFAKRAREKAKKMITALSKCTNVSEDIIYGSGEKKLNSYGSSRAESNNIDLNDRSQELLEKQQELLEQQKRLQQKIELQQKQVAIVKQQKASELVLQKKLKLNAESALSEIQKNYEKLAISLGCDRALNTQKISFIRGLEVLERESLQQTRIYYSNKFSEIVEKFNEYLSECGNNW